MALTHTRKSSIAGALVALLLGPLAVLAPTPLAPVVHTAEAAPISPPCSRAAIVSVPAGGLILPSPSAPNTASLAVTGSGFYSFEPVTVYFNAAVPFGGSDQGSSATATTADVNGAIAVTLPLNARPAANSQYVVAAVGVGGSCATSGSVAIGAVPAIEGVSAALSPDSLTVGSRLQTVLISSTIVPSNVVSLAATIDASSTNNYGTAGQTSPQAIGAFPRPDLSTPTYAVFQLAVPGALTPNVHTVMLVGTASGSAATYHDAAGLRYKATAPATLSASPGGAPAFSTITVNGGGFAGSSAATVQPITITLTGAGGSSPILTTTTTSSISGTFSAPLTIPGTAAQGTATLRAVDATGLQATAPLTITSVTTAAGSASLTVVPSGSACPAPAGVTASAVPTETVILILGGYTANETVNLVVNNIQFATLKVDANGNLNTQALFPVANRDSTPLNGLPGDRGITQGVYTVSAVGSASGKVATQTIATCSTTLTGSSPLIAGGAAQTISGAGFASGEVVTVTSYLGSAAGSLAGPTASGVAPAFVATANQLGQFTGTFTAPITFTTYTLRAQGSLSNLVATTAITSTAAGLTLATGPVYPCSPFTLSATGGFTPSDVISLTAQGGATVTTTATASGGFAATVTAPANTAAGTLAVAIASRRGSIVVAQPITVPTAALTVSPATAPQGGTVSVVGADYIPSAPVTISMEFVANGVAVPAGGPTQVVTASASGDFTTTMSISPTVVVINGNYQLRGASACSAANTATAALSVSGVVAPPPTPRPSAQPTTIYFAEGYTGRRATNGRADFDEEIAVLNPESFATTVTFTYQIQGQAVPVVKTVAVGANSVLRESVNGDVGPDRIVSAIVSADYRIAAERVMQRMAEAGRLDSTSSLGNTAPGTTWYFAEGYTGATFQQYLTIQNPSAAPANVTVTFLPQNVPSASPRAVTLTVPANSRATENIRRDYLPYGGQSVGMIVTSDQPIVAERVLYFGTGAGSAKFGGTAKAGLSDPAQQFFFAFGSRPGSDTANALAPGQTVNDESYVTVVNPNATVATVQVDFYSAIGQRLGGQALTVAPRTRRTTVVNSILGPVRGPFSTRVTADQPILVERPQYFGGSPNIGRHPGVSLSGAPGGLQTLLFPRLNTALADGTPLVETIYLLNLGSSTITVTGTYYTAGGQTLSAPYSVGAGQITVVNVNTETRTLPLGPLGARFTSTDGPFVATRIANMPDGLSYIGDQGVAVR